MCVCYFSIDGQNEVNSMGIYINDICGKCANCVIKMIPFDGEPHLCIFAKKQIMKDEELRYDYGENCATWRKVSTTTIRIKELLYYIACNACFYGSEIICFILFLINNILWHSSSM